MDILTSLSSVLFGQQVFIIFFVILVFAALFIVYSYIKGPAKQGTTTDEAVSLRLEYEEKIKGLQDKNTELEKAGGLFKGQIEAQAKDWAAKSSVQLKDKENQIVSLQKELSGAKDKLASQTAIGPLQEELKKKDEALKNESAAKEKQGLELKEAQKKILELTADKEGLNKQLQNKPADGEADKLKEELKKKDASLQQEAVEKGELSKKLKEAQNQFSNACEQVNALRVQLENKPALEPQLEKSEEELKDKGNLVSDLKTELKSSQEVYHGLREQYAELERVVDALNQSLALEKTLHQRLKEEHASCGKPPSSNNPQAPPVAT